MDTWKSFTGAYWPSSVPKYVTGWIGQLVRQETVIVCVENSGASEVALAWLDIRAIDTGGRAYEPSPN